MKVECGLIHFQKEKALTNKGVFNISPSFGTSGHADRNNGRKCKKD
jgi:hypothetical protein